MPIEKKVETPIKEVPDEELEDVDTFDVAMVVHTSDRDSQKIVFKNLTNEKFDNILNTTISSLGTIRTTSSLTLAATDGTIYIFNVDNVTCVEIRRS